MLGPVCQMVDEGLAKDKLQVLSVVSPHPAGEPGISRGLREQVGVGTAGPEERKRERESERERERERERSK